MTIPPTSMNCLPCCLTNSAALAYFLASISPGVVVAMPVLSFMLVLSLIICGFMIRTAAIPVYW